MFANPLMPKTAAAEILAKMIVNNSIPYSRITYSPNEVVTKGARLNREIFFLRSGIVKTSIFSVTGKEKILFLSQPNTIFGMSLAGIPEAVSIAITQSEVLRIDQREIDSLVFRDKQFSELLDQDVQTIMNNLYYEVTALSFCTTKQRLTALLILLAIQLPPLEGRVEIPIDNDDLASILGCSRNSVTSAMNYLVKIGVVKKVRKGVVVTNMNKLKDEVDFQKNYLAT